MRDEFGTQAASQRLTVQVNARPARRQPPMNWLRPTISGTATGGSTGAAESKPDPVRSQIKLGRNDPCWCGSGKKYKNCHLKDDQAKSK